MADIRELIILNFGLIKLGKATTVSRLLGAARMRLRRAVILTGKLPVFRSLYKAAYHAHIAVMRRLAISFKGTLAIYVTAGIGRGEIRPGVSDIDFVIFGQWPEKKQLRLLTVMAVVVLLMPLFDRESLGSIVTWEDFSRMNDSDLLLAYHYASAKRNWKLLWGEDLIQRLPDLSEERRAAASYQEMRRWWGTFISMAVGEGITARDEVFRNSLSFKAVSDVLRAEMIARGEIPPKRRTELLQRGLAEGDGELVTRLLASEAKTFVAIEGDPREYAGRWLLQRMECVHTTILDAPSFAHRGAVRVQGDAAELLISDQTRAHIEGVRRRAAEAGLAEKAYLVPSASFLQPDSLALLLEVDREQLPSMADLRTLLAPHFEVAPKLPQRVAVYLLLEHGAFLLDFLFGLEVSSTILMPQANPDVFSLLSRPEFSLTGNPRAPVRDLRWSRASQENMEEELHARLGAHVRYGMASRPSDLENLRNFWRLLQLLIMERQQDGIVNLPVTLPAVCRAVTDLLPEIAEELVLLLDAMHNAAENTAKSDPIGAAMLRVYLAIQNIELVTPRISSVAAT